MIKKTNVRLIMFLLFFMVFNVFIFLNAIKINATSSETVTFEMRHVAGANNTTRTIFVSHNPNYDASFCLEYSNQVPNGADRYTIGQSKYAGTSLEKMIGNIFYYGHPKVSVGQLISKYGGSNAYNEYDMLEFTNRVYWTAQKMYEQGIPFTMTSVDTMNPNQLGGGNNNPMWLRDNPIVYGIMKSAVTDYQNGIYRTPAPPSTQASLTQGTGFAIVENGANTVKIGPFKVNTDSSLPSSQLNFNIIIDNPAAYAVNSAGNRITSVNVNDTFYIIANKTDAVNNIGVKISGIVDYYYYYKFAISSNPNKQEMMITKKEPVYGEDEIVITLEPPQAPGINKKVNGKDEETLVNRNDTFLYTISVPIEQNTGGYASIEIRDELEDVLEIITSEVDVTVNGVSIIPSGTLNVNGNLVTFKFNSGFNYSTIAGKTVVMSIKAKIRSNVTDEELISRYGENRVPNKATLVFNDRPTDSNIVKVKPPCNAKLGDYVWFDVNKNGIQDANEAGIPNVIVTLYNESGNKVKETVTDEDGYYIFENLCAGSYYVEFETPSGYKPTLKGSGTDREKDSNINPNGKTDLITIKNGDEDLSIDAGYVLVDGPTISKKVNGKDEVTLQNRNEIFLYTISVPIEQNTNGYTSLEIMDELEDVLEIITSEVDVTINGVSIISSGTLDVNGNLVTFKFNDGFNYSTIAGKTVVMSIKAKIKSNVTDEELIDRYGENKVPNKATLVFNDEPIDSNIVKVKPPCSAKLGDYVWLDVNKNGIQDVNETGIPNVVVTLYNESGNKVKETVTDEDGYYIFENLCAGSYYVEFETPSGYKPTTKGSKADGEKDSNINSSGKTDLITIKNGDEDLSIDAGYVLTDGPSLNKKVDGKDEATLQNRNEVFLYTISVPIEQDTNGYTSLEIRDQLEDVLEIITSEVDVTIDGVSIISSGTLNISGNLVTFKFNSGFNYSTIAGKTVVMSIKAKIKSSVTDEELMSRYGENRVPNKATLVFNDRPIDSNEVKVKPPCDAKLGDYVWVDANKNGIQDAGESGIPNVVVTLYNENGNKIKETMTDSSGYYIFENLCAGSYYVEFETPNGYKPTIKGSGTDRAKDSNIDPNGKTDLITIKNGDEDLSIDAGYVLIDEPHINKKVDGKDEVTLENREETFTYTINVGVPIDTTGFTSMEIRDQLEDVLEIVNSGVDVKVDGVSIISSGALNISGNLVTFKFKDGFDYSTIAGKIVVMSIKAKIKADVTNTDLIDKYGEKKVANKATLIFNDKPTDSNIVKVQPPCDAKLGDFVWTDKNEDGIQDLDEPGISNVVVILYDEDGNKVKETVTDSNGYYTFDGLCDGDYYVKFEIPNGYQPTIKEEGVDREKDSNINPDGKTDRITIKDGKSDMTIDAGFVEIKAPDEPSIIKRVEGRNEVVLGNRNDTFLYAINVAIPQDTTGYNSLEIKDQLEDVLEVVNSEVDVRMDDVSIISKGALNISGNLVTFKFSPEFDYSTIAGKNIMMVIKARIKAGITDDQLTLKYGENKVPNKASLVFNDKPIDSNVVKVQPPTKVVTLPQTGEKNLFEALFKLNFKK